MSFDFVLCVLSSFKQQLILTERIVQYPKGNKKKEIKQEQKANKAIKHKCCCCCCWLMPCGPVLRSPTRNIPMRRRLCDKKALFLRCCCCCYRQAKCWWMKWNKNEPPSSCPPYSALLCWCCYGRRPHRRQFYGSHQRTDYDCEMAYALVLLLLLLPLHWHGVCSTLPYVSFPLFPSFRMGPVPQGPADRWTTVAFFIITFLHDVIVARTRLPVQFCDDWTSENFTNR